MRALGLWQPYASLIRCGIKTLETRPWRTTPGPFVVCSTKSIAPDYEETLERVRQFGFELDTLPTGVTLCVVNITKVRTCLEGTDERAACTLTLRDKNGRLKAGFELDVPKLLMPRPVTCRQGWFHIPDSDLHYEF